MVTGKTYRSIGVILVLGGVLYIFMATRITRISVQDVVVFQPVPTDKASQNTFQINTTHLQLSTDNNTRPRYITPNGIKENIIKYRKGTRVKVTGDKYFNSRPSAAVTEQLESSDNNITILSNKTIVIIVAYMRTGSTLTGSVFQQYPGTFYLFEPIRSVRRVFKVFKSRRKAYATFNYIHGKKRNVQYSEEDRLRVEEINNWLTCRLDAISLHSLTDIFHYHYTKIMKRFFVCAKGRPIPKPKGEKKQRLQRYYGRSNNIDSCFKAVISNCQKAPLLAIKYIRIQMEEVLKLLPFYPNMKVIHLVRDPRGILNSRIKVNAVSRKDFREHLNKHCSSVYNNLKYSERILQTYKNRLRLVYYEDIAEDPVGTVRNLVEFAGLEFLPHIQDYIRNQTNSTRDSCSYCTQRKDSNSTANKWRIQLDSKVANDIYEACTPSNSILGYLPLNNSTIRNQKIPSRKVLDVEKELLKGKIFY